MQGSGGQRDGSRHTAQKRVLQNRRGPADGLGRFQPLLEGEGSRQLDCLAAQGRFDKLYLGFGRPLQRPVFRPGGAVLPGGGYRAEPDAEHAQAVQEKRPVQIEKGRLLRLDARVFTQVQFKRLRGQRLVFFEL